MRNQNHFVSECQFQASNRPCFGVRNNCSTTYLRVITYIITMAHYNYFVGIHYSCNNTCILGRNPGLVVKGGDSYQKVVSSNPSTRYWMDIFSH